MRKIWLSMWDWGRVFDAWEIVCGCVEGNWRECGVCGVWMSRVNYARHFRTRAIVSAWTRAEQKRPRYTGANCLSLADFLICHELKILKPEVGNQTAVDNQGWANAHPCPSPLTITPLVSICGVNEGRQLWAGRESKKEPEGGRPSARCEEGRCPTQTFRSTRGPAGCGTPEVGQAPDGSRLASNRNEMESMRWRCSQEMTEKKKWKKIEKKKTNDQSFYGTINCVWG